VKVLVVDDIAYSRRALRSVLSARATLRLKLRDQLDEGLDQVGIELRAGAE
jgi:hypoxanthine phosphoribosyltransferase